MGIAQSLQMDYLNNLHDSEGVVMPISGQYNAIEQPSTTFL